MVKTKIIFTAKMLFGIAFIALINTSCTETKKQEHAQFKSSKKEEYVKPKNTSYDSISGTYEVTPPYDSINFFMGCIQPGSRSYIAVERTRLMKDSLLEKPFDQFVELGDTVTIEHYINTEYTHEFWAEPIYKVKVKSHGKEYDGYLPQNVIAIAVEKLSDNNFLLLRLADFVKDNLDNTDFYVEAIVVDSVYNLIFCKNKFQVMGGEKGERELWHYYYTMSLKKLPASGLEGAIDVLSLNMNYPACGYGGGNMLWIWDGKQIYYGYQDYEGSDAGAYSRYAYPILPPDKLGKKNSILSVTNTISYEITETNEENILEHDSLVIQYSWMKNKGIVKTDTLFSGPKK